MKGTGKSSFIWRGVFIIIAAVLMIGGNQREALSIVSVETERICGMCHKADKLDRIFALDKTRQEWLVIVRQMKGLGAPIDESDIETIASDLAGESSLDVGSMDANHSATAANIYKWEDEKGGIHFADDIYKVPPEYRGALEQRSIKSRRSASSSMQPADVYMAFWRALDAGNYEEAGIYLSKKLKQSITSGDMSSLAWAISGMQSATMHSVKVANSDVSGDTARVVVTGKLTEEGLKGKSHEEDYSAAIELVKEEGTWKILRESWAVDD
ncbi:MAG: DUF4124 domain-containing protein [Thermodesulfobacteriota bacterium]